MAEFRDEINCAKPRRSYLITYSQADLNKFPTRQSFAAAVCEVLNRFKKRKLESLRHFKMTFSKTKSRN
jgi:hypothetical protein